MALMAVASDGLLDKAGSFLGKWTSYAAFGTFVLYLLGYLTMRFHFYSFGIFAELAVLDERYLFAGAQFLVYLAGTIPILAVVALIVRLLDKLVARWSLRQRVVDFFAVGNRLAIWGVLLSVAVIQFVSRQCYAFSNLLLRNELPPPVWLHCVLLDEAGGLQQIYFALLTIGALVAAWMARAAWSRSVPTRWPALLALLAGIQFLFLPVNFGILVANKELPSIETDAGPRWLVWTDEKSVTFLERAGNGERFLIVERKDDVKTLRTSAPESILNELFAKR